MERGLLRGKPHGSQLDYWLEGLLEVWSSKAKRHQIMSQGNSDERRKEHSVERYTLVGWRGLTFATDDNCLVAGKTPCFSDGGQVFPVGDTNHL